MSAYYQGRRARSYDQRWRHFTQRTLEETLVQIDVEPFSIVHRNTNAHHAC